MSTGKVLPHAESRVPCGSICVEENEDAADAPGGAHPSVCPIVRRAYKRVKTQNADVKSLLLAAKEVPYPLAGLLSHPPASQPATVLPCYLVTSWTTCSQRHFPSPNRPAAMRVWGVLGALSCRADCFALCGWA
jgi:hypothetical protein